MEREGSIYLTGYETQPMLILYYMVIINVSRNSVQETKEDPTVFYMKPKCCAREVLKYIIDGLDSITLVGSYPAPSP